MVYDLFGITRNLTECVNASMQGILKISDDFEVQEGSFRPVPKITELLIEIDVQSVSSSDLARLSNISQQSDLRSVYILGGIKGLNRPLQTGGDMINFDGSDWKVIQVLEEWGTAEWSKVLVSRQLPQARQ